MFWISTDAVMYLTVGSGTPDAVFNRILGTGFSMMLVICATLDCANKDINEPESSIISKVECPIFPIITAVCILVVATIYDPYSSFLNYLYSFFSFLYPVMDLMQGHWYRSSRPGNCWTNIFRFI